MQNVCKAGHGNMLSSANSKRFEVEETGTMQSANGAITVGRDFETISLNLIFESMLNPLYRKRNKKT